MQWKCSSVNLGRQPIGDLMFSSMRLSLAKGLHSAELPWVFKFTQTSAASVRSYLASYIPTHFNSWF